MFTMEGEENSIADEESIAFETDKRATMGKYNIEPVLVPGHKRSKSLKPIEIEAVDIQLEENNTDNLKENHKENSTNDRVLHRRGSIPKKVQKARNG